VCPLNNISFYYSAYIQFCQVLFLNIIDCVIIVLDKIGNRVYNVHRNHQGGLYIYTIAIYTYPLGVFQGILSEYLALKYGQIVVYMDFGNFLVTGYIYGVHPHHTLAHPSVFWGHLVNQKNICRSHKYCSGCSRVVSDLFRGV
jgi:hypothetical protein